MRPLVALLLLGAAPVDGFDAFWAGFRQAVAAQDAKAITAQTQTPFLFEGNSLDAAAFATAAPRLFDAPIRACFRQPKLLAEGDQRLLFCRGTIFVFAPTKAGWRFTEIGVDD